MNKKKSKRKETIKMFFNNMRICFIPLSFFMLIVSIVSYFAIENDIIKYIIAVVVVVLAVVVSFIVQAVKLKRSQRQSPDGQAAQVFLSEYERMKNNRDNYSRIIEMGPIITRNLYLASRYEERIKIAQIVLDVAKESSAIDTTRKYEYGMVIARTQINDLGWTTVLYGNKEEGKKYIEEGLITLADLEQWCNDNDLTNHQQEIFQLHAKAKRYLGSIYTVLQKYDEARATFNEVKELCDVIVNEQVRKRFLAGLHFAEAELYFMHEHDNAAVLKDSSYDKAMELCKMAYRERKELPSTDDRYTRYWAQSGKIRYFAYRQKRPINGKLDSLDDIQKDFETGLFLAKKTTRIDEIKKNSYGLACCLLVKGRKRKARKEIKLFGAQYGDIDLFDTDDILLDEYVSLERDV